MGAQRTQSSRVSLPRDSGLLERTGPPSPVLSGLRGRGCAWHLSFLTVGLFQELVLLCGDPYHLLPRAEWHLPSASAAELPLAHELPGEQVSETVVEQGWWHPRWRPRMNMGLVVTLHRGCRGVLGPVGWAEQGDPWPHPHPRQPPYAPGAPGGPPGGRIPPLPTCIHLVRLHCCGGGRGRTGQPHLQGLPGHLVSRSPHPGGSEGLEELNPLNRGGERLQRGSEVAEDPGVHPHGSPGRWER